MGCYGPARCVCCLTAGGLIMLKGHGVQDTEFEAMCREIVSREIGVEITAEMVETARRLVAAAAFKVLKAA